MSNVFLISAIVSIVCGVVSSVMITVFLSRRGIKINYLFIKLYIYKYVNQYRKITIEENGKVGPLFYSYIGSFILALLFVVVMAILKVST